MKYFSYSNFFFSFFFFLFSFFFFCWIIPISVKLTIKNSSILITLFIGVVWCKLLYLKSQARQHSFIFQWTPNLRRLGLFDFSIPCHLCSLIFFEWSYLFLFLLSQITKKGDLLKGTNGQRQHWLKFHDWIIT